MKRTALFSTLLLAVAMSVISGCDPTLNTEGGRKVKFSAISQASPATKTAYGAMDGSNWQTISWKVGDAIRIYAPAGGSISGKPIDPVFDLNYVYADYTVKEFGNSGHLSKGKLDNDDANGLTWTGDEDAVFYAAYPGDEVQIATNTDGKLRFYFEIPNTQDGKPEFISKLPMLSIQEVANNQPVELDFYPAFSAFEFNIKSDVDESFTVDWVELSVDETLQRRFPLTGSCYYDMNPLLLANPNNYVTDPRYPHYMKLSLSDTGNRGFSIKFNLGATISKTQEASFTFFALPYDHTGLVFRLQCSKTVNGATETTIRKLKLTRTTTSGTAWVDFHAGHKAVITGMAVNSDLWCFQTITLSGEVLEWVAANESTASGNNPEATQFAVTGENVSNMYQRHNNALAYKPYRQYWILEGTDVTATVDFKIMSPSSGSYTVTPQGDVDDFTVEGTLSGSISGLTKVNFTVTPKDSALNTDKKIWFITTVTASDGTVFNIDSETQLFDMRGYHYFLTREPSI